MTNFPFRTAALALSLLGICALGACSGGSGSEHAEPGHAEVARSSSAGLPAGHVAAGEELAATKGQATGQSCIDCHGVDGNAPIDASYPKLGGQYASYLGHALQAYREGARENVLMSSQARELSDQQIADLAAYFGSRPSELSDLGDSH